MSIYYISYDINMSSSKMKEYFPDAKVVLKCQLNNTRLRFYGEADCAYPTIESCSGETVPAVVWGLDLEDLELLDCIYEADECYERIDYKLFGETEIKAFTYVMEVEQDIGMPSEAYLGILLDAYDEHGFNPSALEEALDFSLRHKNGMGSD